MKIGRNELCPCGSGEKYKRCCISDRSSIAHRKPKAENSLPHQWLVRKREEITDVTVQKITEIAASIPDAVYNAREWQFRAELEGALKSIFPRPASTLEECARALESLRSWIEDQLREVLHGHSPLFWMILNRIYSWWALPDKDVQFFKPFAKELDLTSTLAFLKFGDWDRTDDVMLLTSSPLDLSPTKDALLEWNTSCKGLLFLCRSVFHHSSRLREGAVLDVIDGELRSELPDSQEASHDLDVERKRRFQSVLTPRGFPVYPRYARQDSARAEDEIVQFKLRTEDSVQANSQLGAPIQHQAYSPGLLQLDDAFQTLELFESSIEKHAHLSVEQLKRLYRVLNLFLMKAIITPKSEFQYISLRFGLLVLPQEDFLSAFSEMMCRQHPSLQPEGARIEAELFLTHLAADRDAALKSNIFFSTGTGCIHKWGQHLAIDLSHTAMPLIDMAYRIKASGTQKRAKGAIFEKYLLNYISKAIPNLSMPIAPNTHLSSKGKVFAEVDVWIQMDDVVLAVDCKAWCQTEEFLQADLVARSDREALIERLLSDGDKRACKIAENPHGDNYSMPSRIRGILALVCTPDPEFANVLRTYP